MKTNSNLIKFDVRKKKCSSVSIKKQETSSAEVIQLNQKPSVMGITAFALRVLRSKKLA